MNVQPPIVPEFESEEQAASYDRWLRAKVQASLDDPQPSIPHDEAMAKVEQILEDKRKARRTATHTGRTKALSARTHQSSPD